MNIQNINKNYYSQWSMIWWTKSSPVLQFALFKKLFDSEICQRNFSFVPTLNNN